MNMCITIDLPIYMKKSQLYRIEKRKNEFFSLNYFRVRCRPNASLTLQVCQPRMLVVKGDPMQVEAIDTEILTLR